MEPTRQGLMLGDAEQLPIAEIPSVSEGGDSWDGTRSSPGHKLMEDNQTPVGGESLAGADVEGNAENTILV